MLDVPFSEDEESLARRRYEECAQRRESSATTADEHARRADACVEVGTFALAFDTACGAHAAFADAADASLESIEARVRNPTGLEYAALPLHAWRGTYAALLAGESARCRAFADAMGRADQEPDPSVALDDHPFWYATAVTAAAAGADERASIHSRTLAPEASGRLERRRSYAVLSTATVVPWRPDWTTYSTTTENASRILPDANSTRQCSPPRQRRSRCWRGSAGWSTTPRVDSSPRRSSGRRWGNCPKTELHPLQRFLRRSAHVTPDAAHRAPDSPARTARRFRRQKSQ